MLKECCSLTIFSNLTIKSEKQDQKDKIWKSQNFRRHLAAKFVHLFTGCLSMVVHMLKALLDVTACSMLMFSLCYVAVHSAGRAGDPLRACVCVADVRAQRQAPELESAQLSAEVQWITWCGGEHSLATRHIETRQIGIQNGCI